MSTTIEGVASICAHRITWNYEVEDLQVTPAMQKALENEAEERAKTMIIEGFTSGELNCVWNEHEIRGWWQIE